MGKLPHKLWFHYVKVSRKTTTDCHRLGHCATPEYLHRTGFYDSPNFSCGKIGIRHILLECPNNKRSIDNVYKLMLKNCMTN